MGIKSYALLHDDGTVWGVIACEPREIRRHTLAFGLDAYIRRPDENAGGKLKMIEPGARVSGGHKVGKKYKNPDSVTIRGSADAVLPSELPTDDQEDE